MSSLLALTSFWTKIWVIGDLRRLIWRRWDVFLKGEVPNCVQIWTNHLVGQDFNKILTTMANIYHNHQIYSRIAKAPQSSH